MSTTRSWWLAGVCLGLIITVAAILARFQSHHRLGQPGVRLTNLRLLDEKGEFATTNSIYLPEQLLEFRSELLPVSREIELVMLPPDTTFGRRLYTAPDGFQVQLSGVLMGTDRTSIHKPEYCLPGQGFAIVARSQRTITIDRPHRYQLPITRLDAIREVRLPNGQVASQGAVYVYWFVSENRISNDHLERMWWLALDLVRTGELQRWAYMGCLGACIPGQEDAVYQRLERMIQELVPQFQTTTGPNIAAVSDSPSSSNLQHPSPQLAEANPNPQAATYPRDFGSSTSSPQQR
ncbi:MAG: exosortase-associated EpsI family protein [Verrucomicrobiales bacterium]|nr:exosortase-associated EpsI family protein [Verrucomicrobiales bacterium]